MLAMDSKPGRRRPPARQGDKETPRRRAHVAHEPDGVAAPEHLFGPDMRADPYPVYHRLRATDPMHWDERLRVWIVTRYRGVRRGGGDSLAGGTPA
jgi:hypothetical protein